MRSKRLKQYKKAMQVYQNVYGFRVPFQVLMDGTIIVVAHKHKMSLVDIVPRILSGSSKLLYTSCVVKELEDLADKVEDKDIQKNIKSAIHFARKNFEWRKCDHVKECVSAKECIASMVGQKNAHKFSVGTQDLELRQKLRSIPGVPLFYIKNSVCILEPHSHITAQTAEKIEIQKTLPESFENIPKGASESGIKKAKKKKRSIEPNPLSCKKPKTKPADNTESRETSTSEKPKKKKRGSRGHGSKHVKELEA